MESGCYRGARVSGRFRLGQIALGVGVVGAILMGCGGRPSRVTLIPGPDVPTSLSTSPTLSLNPQTHEILLAWLGGDGTQWQVWYSRSSDAGKTWAPAVAVSPPGEAIELADGSGPRLACDAQGRVAILWSTAGSLGDRGSRNELRFVRSVDRGTTWSEPTTLLPESTQVPTSRRFQDLTSNDDGLLVAGWVEMSDGGSASGSAVIHLASSKDLGEHWENAHAVWSHACPCSRPGLSMDLFVGPFASLRRHHEDGACDMAVARPDGPPVRVHSDGWTDPGCRETAPGFRVARDGSLRVAWFTGAPGRSGLWFRQGFPERWDSTAVPMNLIPGSEPLRVSLEDVGMSGTALACDGDSTGAGALSLFRVVPNGRRVAERQVVNGVRNAFGPEVAGSNRIPQAYVAWTERSGEERRIRLLRWDLGR